jgi:hypothetical protein
LGDPAKGADQSPARVLHEQAIQRTANLTSLPWDRFTILAGSGSIALHPSLSPRVMVL